MLYQLSEWRRDYLECIYWISVEIILIQNDIGKFPNYIKKIVPVNKIICTTTVDINMFINFSPFSGVSLVIGRPECLSSCTHIWNDTKKKKKNCVQSKGWLPKAWLSIFCKKNCQALCKIWCKHGTWIYQSL